MGKCSIPDKLSTTVASIRILKGDGKKGLFYALFTFTLVFLFVVQGIRTVISSIYFFNMESMGFSLALLFIGSFFTPLIYFLGVLKKESHAFSFLMTGFIIIVGRALMCFHLNILFTTIASAFTLGATLFFIPLFCNAIFTYVKQDIEEKKVLDSSMVSLKGPLVLSTGVGLTLIIDYLFRAAGYWFDISVYGLYLEGKLLIHPFLITLPLLLSFLYSLVNSHTILYREYEPSISSECTSSRLSLLDRNLFLPLSIGLISAFLTGFMIHPNTLIRWMPQSRYTLSGVNPMPLFLLAVSAVALFLVLLPHMTVRLGRKQYLGLLSSLNLLFLFSLIGWSHTDLLIFSYMTGISIFVLLLDFSVVLNDFWMYFSKAADFGSVIFKGFIFYFIWIFIYILSIIYGQLSVVSFLEGMLEETILFSGLLLAVLTVINGWRFKSGLEERSEDASFRYLPKRSRKGEKRSSVLQLLITTLLVTALLISVVYHPNVKDEDRGPKEELTVMTYNIFQGYNVDGGSSPEELYRVIERTDPDILLLQESETNRLTSGQTGLIYWLSHHLEYEHHYFGPPTREQIYGVSIMSRYPMQNCSVTYLPSPKDQRVAVRAEVNIHTPQGRRGVSVYSVHLGLEKGERRVQTDALMKNLEKEKNDRPMIIGGDFNSRPDTRTIQIFQSNFTDTWTERKENSSGYTYSSKRPRERIDYVFATEQDFEVERTWIVDDARASDHLPVVTRLRFNSSG